MISNIDEYTNFPLFNALKDLNDEMINANMPKVEINVVGGFALMLHNLRDKDDDRTDIDYIGAPLPTQLRDIVNNISIKNHLVKDWLNNDLMLTGTTLKDLEYSTGELHFLPAFELEKIKVNVLETKDLLRMKMIAIDSSITAIDDGGEFTRHKDLKDIMTLSNKLGIQLSDLNKIYGKYLINENTTSIIQTYAEKGMQAVDLQLKKLRFIALDKQIEEMEHSVDKDIYTRSPLIDSVLNKAMARAKSMNEER